MEKSFDPNIAEVLDELFSIWEQDREAAQTDIELEASTVTGRALIETYGLFTALRNFNLIDKTNEYCERINDRLTEVRCFGEVLKVVLDVPKTANVHYDDFDICDAFDNVAGMDESSEDIPSTKAVPDSSEPSWDDVMKWFGE